MIINHFDRQTHFLLIISTFYCNWIGWVFVGWLILKWENLTASFFLLLWLMMIISQSNIRLRCLHLAKYQGQPHSNGNVDEHKKTLTNKCLGDKIPFRNSTNTKQHLINRLFRKKDNGMDFDSKSNTIW